MRYRAQLRMKKTEALPNPAWSCLLFPADRWSALQGEHKSGERLKGRLAKPMSRTPCGAMKSQRPGSTADDGAAARGGCRVRNPLNRLKEISVTLSTCRCRVRKPMSSSPPPSAGMRRRSNVSRRWAGVPIRRQYPLICINGIDPGFAGRARMDGQESRDEW